MRSRAPGSHREAVTPQVPGRLQLDLLFDAENERNTAARARLDAFRRAVLAFGGADALRLALGRPETYLSKISEALTGSKPVQEGWRDPLLRDPCSAIILLEHDAAVAGAEAPVFKREVSGEDVARAALEVLAESGQLRETFKVQIAKKLGVRPEAVRL